MITQNEDPAVRVRELWRENLWLRDTLVRVAEELERMATDPSRPPRDYGQLLNRAQLVRARLAEGPPAGWTPRGFGDTGEGDPGS